MKEAGIKPLEYEGEIEKAQKYSNNRAALDYINDDVSPDLENMFGEDQASKIRAKIFRLFVGLNSTVVNEIRKKYAVQYANNCTQNGHYGFAEKWDDVINSIP